MIDGVWMVGLNAEGAFDWVDENLPCRSLSGFVLATFIYMALYAYN